MEIIDQILELKELSETTNSDWYHSDKIFTTNTGKPIHSTILSASLQRANARLETPINKHLSPHITHVTRNMKDQAVNILDNIITNNLAPSLPLG